MTATPVRMRCWKTTLVILIGGIVAAAAVDEAVLIRIQQAIQAGELRSARIEVLNALKSGPADPRLHNFLGVIDAQEQDFHGAETAFQRAIALAPRFTGAYLNLGRLYEQHTGPGVLEKALDVYRGLLQFEPGNVEANYQCAWILNRLGKFEGSLKYLARLSEPAQARAAALALRCGDYAALDNTREAAASVKQLLAAADLTDADILPIVPALREHHRADLATALLEQLARRSPASAEVLMQLARSAYQAGHFEGALGYLAHARDLEPGKAVIHYLFGLICIELKLPPEAKQSLQEAVRRDPDNPYFHYALGAVLLQQKSADEAIPHFQKFRQGRPDDPRGNFALGVAYFDAYRMDAARRELESAANHAQTRMGANLYLGRLALREDKLQEASDHLQMAIQANPSEPEAYAELGLVQIRRHEYDLAGRSLAQALHIAPDHYRANLNLLMLYQREKDARTGQQAQRVEHLQKAGEERERMLLRSLEIRPY